MPVNRPITIDFLLAKPEYFVALGFGAGLSPYAPGTVGAGVGILMYWAIAALPAMLQFGLLILLFAVGCYVCQVTGSALDNRDHEAIVWDEICGMAIVLSVIPASPKNWAAAFILFRIFDILKPWPIGYVDRHTRGGFAVMFDDLLAAVCAILLLLGLNRLAG